MTPPTREQVVQLLPCPFCGSGDVRNVSAGHAGPSSRLHFGDEIFAVNCGTCGASVPNRYRNELVVEAWNKRAALARADLEAQLKAAQEEIALLKSAVSHEADVADSYKAQLASAEQRDAEACELLLKSKHNYEVSAAKHHAGRWQPAYDYHMTRQAVISECLSAIRSGDWRKFVKGE